MKTIKMITKLVAVTVSMAMLCPDMVFTETLEELPIQEGEQIVLEDAGVETETYEDEIQSDGDEASTRKIILGFDTLTAGLCTDSAAKVRYGGYTWRVIGYNGDGIASGGAGEKKLTLFSEGYIGESAFREKADEVNTYPWSQLENSVNTIYNSFGDKEKSFVLPRALTTNDGVNLPPGYPSIDANIWPLSTSEASQLRDNAWNMTVIRQHWWLRSPGYNDKSAAFIYDNGTLADNAPLNYSYKVRPAFNLDTSSILFISATEDGKSSTGSNGELTPVGGDYNVDDWRLTCKDDTRSFTVTSSKSVSGDAGSTVAITYTNAKTETNEYISAILLSSTEVLYYGRLQKATNANGTASLVIPQGLRPGRYTIKVFNENCNTNEDGTTHIDYSSDPVDISLKVTGVLQDPAVEDFQVILPSNTVYDGKPRIATAKTVDGVTGMGDITVTYYKNGEKLTDAPKDPGTYEVKVDVTEGDSYNAATGITKDTWTFTISEPKPVVTPTFSPAAGTYTEAQSVTINCATEDAKIYYTTDGSIPTTDSKHFTGAISVTTTMTIKAVAVKDGMTDSDVATATYTINKSEPVRTYSVTVTTDKNGSASANPNSSAAGKTITLTAKANKGYKFKDWTSSNGITFANATSAFTTFSMPAKDVTVTANFEKEADPEPGPKPVPGPDPEPEPKPEPEPQPTQKDISKATVSGIKNKTYTGKKITQALTVALDGQTLKADIDYTVSYKNNKNVGTAKVTITGKGDYTGSVTKSFKIKQAANKLTVKAKKATYSSTYSKNKSKTIGGTKIYKFTNKKKTKGTIKYSLSSVKKDGKKVKGFSVSKSNGKLTIKKGVAKGSYKITVKVTAGDKNYKTVKKNVKFTLKIK